MPVTTPPAPPDPHLTSRHTLLVRFCEADLMGIVHHSNYVVFLEAGRVDWLHRRGVLYEDWARRGIHLPVIELRLRYRKVARFNEVLVIESSRRELRPATVRFTHRILRGEDVLCEAETLLTCVGNDLDLKVFPDEAVAVFESPETSSPPFP